ncbi:two-component system, OmpR family, sensor histidine kinase KdpD [Granulicella rosea]|uniref:histidine kinase n=1 Tax=Granulicella rosea TaxID=474952 RepID=A0A239M714_9BACT|nr:ATP-binding protein [Granulicella rosea]SNT38526.1 two-component system, OmpR family, sensor histidine kinase KdpD [Granulicella rosea]
MRWATAAAFLAAIVFAYTHLTHVNPTTVALTLLLYILLLAAGWGFRYAVVASFASALCFNFFFLPPIGALTISDSQNWIALFAFLATALIGSNLSDRIKTEAAASNRRRRELELLYDFGQRLLSTEGATDLRKAIPQNIVAAFRTQGAALYLSAGDRVYRFDTARMAVDPERMRGAVHAGVSYKTAGPETALLPLAVGVRPVGSILVEGNLPSQETLEAMSSLIAIAIESASAVEKLARADAAHESERLRSALLDSVTHDLRTPLTSIKASVTSMLTQGALTEEQRMELLTVIDEESDRLNHLIAQATEMARLDAREVALDPAAYTVQQCVERALEEGQAALAGRAVEVRLADTLPRVWIDLDLIVKVLGHLLENASKYSPADSPIFISGVVEGGELALSVADRGAGIDAMEQEMIFDKFYRGQSQRYRVQGTGMGLAISKAIMEAHGGSIRVTSQPGHGSVFTIGLPLAR